MNYNEEAYIQYIDKLRYHLFEDKTLEEIIQDVLKNHRKKRFTAMYLMRDTETFNTFYAKRSELGLEGVFNEVISALFFEKDNLLIKEKFILRLEVKKEMITTPVSEYNLKVLTKDLQAFVWYATKQVLLSPVL